MGPVNKNKRNVVVNRGRQPLSISIAWINKIERQAKRAFLLDHSGDRIDPIYSWRNMEK